MPPSPDDSTAPVRLHVYLARRGCGSRRAMERAISDGRIRVNGQVVATGRNISPGVDRIELDGRLVRSDDPESIYIKLHKPRGVITTASDERGRETVCDLVGADSRLYPIGRLDRQSEGLVLLTNDGQLTNLLTHPRYGHRRRYLVTVPGRLLPSDIYRLRTGISIGDRRTLPAEVKVHSREPGRMVLDMVLREGRNRQIRRMLEACGQRASRLRRIEFAGLTIGGLAVGEWRHLSAAELATLKHSIQASRRARS